MTCLSNRKATKSERKLMPRKNTTELDTVTCPPRLWFEAVFKNGPSVGDLPE
jgi:hypothetical protein